MIGIIDYGVGNLASIENALNKLGVRARISSDPVVLKNAEALILPGVGAAGKGMENLKKEKLDSAIVEAVRHGRPFLGICLGMQLLLSFSEEGSVECLNLVRGRVRKFDCGLKVPQIGWNRVKFEIRNSKFENLFYKIPDGSYFYFVNSYYCVPEDENVIVGTTEYGVEFCSVLQKDNITGVQFHPEKSGNVGMQLLKNWIGL